MPQGPLPLPTQLLKIDPRRGSDVILSTGEWSSVEETAHPAGFLSRAENKVHSIVSVALETCLPLKEDQYTFMISVYVCVCVIPVLAPAQLAHLSSVGLNTCLPFAHHLLQYICTGSSSTGCQIVASVVVKRFRPPSLQCCLLACY